MIRQLAIAGALAGAVGVGGTKFTGSQGGAFTSSDGAKRVSVASGQVFQGFGSDRDDLFNNTNDPQRGDAIRRVMHASEIELRRSKSRNLNQFGKRVTADGNRTSTGAKFISQ